MSPPGSNDVLIRTKKKAVKEADGTVRLVGDGEKTIDRFEIEETFKQLQIAVDLSNLKRLADIRNDIEHMHPQHEPALIQEAIADASHADERREHEEAIKRHQAEYNRLNDRIHAMHVYKLDGLVDTAFYNRMSNRWREEQNRCQREIERRQNADKSYKDEGVALLYLARNA